MANTTRTPIKFDLVQYRSQRLQIISIEGDRVRCTHTDVTGNRATLSLKDFGKENLGSDHTAIWQYNGKVVWNK